MIVVYLAGGRLQVLKTKNEMKKFWKENIENAIIFAETQPPPSADGNAFVEVTEPAEIKQLYLTQYSYRIDDGKSFVLNFTADMYINVVNGIYTPPQVFELENHIKDIYDQLNNGFWLTAQNTSTNLPLLGIYDATMKADIQTILDTYVSENY